MSDGTFPSGCYARQVTTPRRSLSDLWATADCVSPKESMFAEHISHMTDGCHYTLIGGKDTTGEYTDSKPAKRGSPCRWHCSAYISSSVRRCC